MAAKKASKVAVSEQFDEIKAFKFDSGSKLLSLRENSSMISQMIIFHQKLRKK